jgi:flagellar biogenesis protein FliO
MLYLKKFAGRAKKSKVGGPDMQVLSRISLQPKAHLFVVKVGSKTLLLGATDHNINTLSELSDSQKQLSSPKNAFPKASGDSYTKSKAPITKAKPTDALSFKSFLASTLTKQ